MHCVTGILVTLSVYHGVVVRALQLLWNTAHCWLEYSCWSLVSACCAVTTPTLVSPAYALHPSECLLLNSRVGRMRERGPSFLILALKARPRAFSRALCGQRHPCPGASCSTQFPVTPGSSSSLQEARKGENDDFSLVSAFLNTLGFPPEL